MKKKNVMIAATLAGLFVLALAIRLFLIQAQPHIESDGVSYAGSGAQLIEGRGFSGIYPPFYPFMIGLFSLWFGDLELSGRLVSALYGAFLIFPLFFMARWAFGNKVALISCLLALAYPNLCQFSCAVISESTFMFLFMLGLITSWAAISRNQPPLYLLAGLIWGTAYLTRPEGIGYVLFMILIILTNLIKEKRIRWLGYLFLLAAGFLIVSAPYLIYLKRDTGQWTIGRQAGMNLALGESVGRNEDWGMAFEKCYFGLSEDGRQVGYEMMLARPKGLGAYVLSHPAELARRYVVNLHLLNKYVIPGLFCPAVLILFGAGLFLGDPGRTRKASVLFLALVPYLAFPFFIVDPRYFVPFVPIIIIWTARGIVEASARIAELSKDSDSIAAERANRQGLVETALVAMVIISFIPFTFRSFLRNETGASVYKEAGSWIRSNLPPGAVLVCRRPFLPFYSGKEQVVLPFAPLERIIQYARCKGADYLIADENELEERRDMRALLDEAYSSDDLSRVRAFKDKSGKRLNIYQIRE